MIRMKKILSLVLAFIMFVSVCTNGTMPVFAVGSEPTLTAVPVGVTPTEESLGTQVAYVANDTVTVYEYYENGALGMVCTGALGEQIELTAKFTYTVDGVDTVIYHFADSDFAGAMGAADDANYQFILASDVTFTAPEVTPDPKPTETVIPDSATGVSVAGSLPDDVTLTVTEKTLAESGIDTAVYPISGASLFYDVTLLQNSAEYQPENGITVTFPEAAITNCGLVVGDSYHVYHVHDGATDVTGPFEYTGGDISADFANLSVVGISESTTGVDLTTLFGAYVSEENYYAWATITSDTVNVYGAVNSDSTDTYTLTGVNGVAIEIIKKATYENGVLYQFAYRGDDTEIQNIFADANNYFIPDTYLTFTCTCNCGYCTGTSDCACCDNCTCAEVEEDTTPFFATCTTTVNGASITVEGKMISGTELSASAYAVTDPGAFGLTNTANVKAAYDIKLLDADGNAIQPDGSVFVIMDAAAMGLSNGDVVEIIHQHGSTVDTTTHVVINGKLIFPVSGFSVFIVNSTTDTTGTEITGNSADNPYVMTVGDSEIFFDSYGGGASAYTVANTTVAQMYNSDTTYYYFVDGEYKEVKITRGGRWGNYTYTISYADGSDDIDTNLQGNNQPSGYYYQASGSTAYRGEWQVTDESNAISYEITSVNYQNNQHMAPYITVTAKDVGLVTLTYKYVNGGEIHEEILYISVVAPTNELYIDDQVAEIGCLVPVGLEDVDGVIYAWIRSDGQVIRSEALNDDGTVNVSLDRGGLTEGRDPITYTVTATLPDGSTQTASYEVLYSNEILNSSFETPALGYTEGTGGNKYAYNGYPGMYWKTTAPGSSDGQLTQDIEMIQEGTWAATYFGVQYAADGSQYVELNAENFGALYQDILTTPDATLSWAFSHNGRTTSGSNNTMYVIVAAAKDASSIIDENSIDGLIDAIPNGANVPSNGEGYKLTYNGATYYVWKHIADNNANTWEKISGSYSVPDGQYLTRLFFASETNTDSTINKTMGNLIDAVSAGETMSYKIEYYVDGSLVSANTQSGSATVYTSVDLAHLDNYIADGYVLTSAKIQLETGNVDYPGNVNNGLYITAYGDSGDDDYAIILKVYLAKRAVTITKNIVIDGWADMTDEEKIALIGSGLTAEFALTSDSKTYTAKLTIIAVSANGELTAMGEFLDSNGEAPDNGNYTVTETSAPIIGGYSCSTTFDKTSITVSDTEPTASIVCTNTYEQSAGTLVIEKTVTKAYENDTLPNDTFTFTVSGVADGTYDVVLDGVSGTATASDGKLIFTLSGFTVGEKKTITINGISAGTYTVSESEDTDYISNGGGEITVPAGGTGTASFTNEYKRHLADLTITKTGWNATDENQSYIFTVTGPNGFTMDVVINENGSVTIKDLPIGEYTVTENTNWSWRYTPDGGKSKTIKLAVDDKNEVTFDNKRSWIYWLSGDSYNENQFTVKPKDEDE